MSDIITRLLLKTNDFDTNLNKSKQSVNSFQSDIARMASRAGSSIAGFAGGIGIAMGAAEAFNKTIGSTQATGDAFAKNIDQAKASVDAFFTSIAMGNLDDFLSNLGNVVNKAGDLSSMMDELATKKLFVDAELSGLLTQKRIQENISKDKTKSDKDRNDALEKARGLQVKINKLQTELAKTTQKTAYAQLDSAIAKQGLKGNVARETWDFALKDSNTPHLLNYANTYNAKTEQIASAKAHNPYTGGFDDTQESKKLQRQFNAWLKTSDGQFAEFAKHFTQTQDEVGTDLYNAIQLFKQADGMIGAISDAELILNNTDAKINGSYKKQNGGGAGSTGSGDNLAPSGSLAYFDAELSKKNKELIESTDTQARTAIQTSINELKKQRIELLITEKEGSLEALSIQISALKSKFASATTDDARKEIYNLISELESKQLHINLTAKFNDEKAPLKMGGLPTQGIDSKGMKLPKIKSPISKKDINLNDEYNESLLAMGSIMGSLSGAFDENTASVLQWGATLFTTIGQSISAISSMIPVKAADKVATEAQTGANVGEAVSGTLAAHSSIPFAGIAIGLAGVASIIAAMSSIPKFATGGFVPGSSFAGDNVLARVNSGEMILNRGQQGNLFEMLNGKVRTGIDLNVLNRGLYGGIDAGMLYGSSSITKEAPILGDVIQYIKPNESSSNGTQPGEFCIKGADIRLAIKNYENRKSKVRGSNIYI